MKKVKLSEKQKEVVRKMKDGYSIEYDISKKGHFYNFKVDGFDCPFADFFGLILDKVIERKDTNFKLTDDALQIPLD